jgi:large subunit ribosomal protein L18e
MAKRTGPTNPLLVELIRELKKLSIESKSGLWKRLATDLEKPSRVRRVINISKLSRYANDGEIIVVPGKVLGSGAIDKKITVAAFNFSEGAVEKIQEAKGSCMTIEDLMKKNPKTSTIRIMG